MRRTHIARGRVLRVKLGYNPNSSSIGSMIPTFLAWSAGAGGATVIALHVLRAAGVLRRGAKSARPHGNAAAPEATDGAEKPQPR